jgi:hypothetical protein
LRHCLRTYDEAGGQLQVAYLRGVVDVIQSHSGNITLGGVALRLGPRRLRQQPRHWTRSHGCGGPGIYYSFGDGPSTSLFFGPHRRTEVTVSSQRIGSGGCGGG